MQDSENPGFWAFIIICTCVALCFGVAVAVVQVASWWGRKNREDVIWKKEDGKD